ncbi:HNH endonuclease family protein [Streptomyces cyaneofuscatus]
MTASAVRDTQRDSARRPVHGTHRPAHPHQGRRLRPLTPPRAGRLGAVPRRLPTPRPGGPSKCWSWLSYFDEVEVTDARKLDINHMVPLAEAWNSGAHTWMPERREAYAKDLGSERSLVAVTAKTNRTKADKDPTAWVPPAGSARCIYLEDWAATKPHWGLSADDAERAALLELAAPCEDSVVAYEAAP